jgi:hypothetical protein
MAKRHKPKGRGGNKRGNHGGRGRGNFRGGRGGGRGGRGRGVWVDADEDPFIFDEAAKLGELIVMLL